MTRIFFELLILHIFALVYYKVASSNNEECAQYQKITLKAQLTIIIPVYNEQESLPKLISLLKTYMDTSPIKSEILFINDGSTDRSLDIMTLTAAGSSGFEYVSLDKNYGLSTALKAGFDLCTTPYVGYIDADLQTSPMDFMLYFDHLEEYDMINGIRKQRKDNLVKKISSKIANGFRRNMIKDGIEDTCCPLKIIDTGFAQRLPFFKGMHRFIPALVQLQGGKIKQIEVSHFPRYAGSAKYHLLNRIIGPFIDTLAFVWMKQRWIRYDIGEKSSKRPVSIEKSVK